MSSMSIDGGAAFGPCCGLQCSGQLIPDTALSFSSAIAGDYLSTQQAIQGWVSPSLLIDPLLLPDTNDANR